MSDLSQKLNVESLNRCSWPEGEWQLWRRISESRRSMGMSRTATSPNSNIPTGSGRNCRRQQKLRLEMIASNTNRSVCLEFVRQDRPKQNPALAVELHHLELLVDAIII